MIRFSRLLGLAALLALPACAPAVTAPAPATPSAAIVPTTVEQVRRMTPAEVQAAVGRGEALLIVDVRPKESFDAERIVGAVNAPRADLATKGQTTLPKDRLLVLYCTCPEDGSSANAALELSKYGFTQLVALKDGLGAWKAAGLPTEKAVPAPAPAAAASPAP